MVGVDADLALVRSPHVFRKHACCLGRANVAVHDLYGDLAMISPTIISHKKNITLISEKRNLPGVKIKVFVSQIQGLSEIRVGGILVKAPYR